MANYDARQLARNKGNISSIVSDAVRQTPQTNFLKAVVVDVLIDPTANGVPSLNIFDGTKVKNDRYAGIAPRNSIMAMIVSDGAAKKDGGAIVCFPFFPPHLSMPVNPGETVWVMTDSVTGEAPLYYWVCRVSEPDFVDDINYTHSDRRFQGNKARGTADRARLASDDASSYRPGFPNGAGTRDSTTLPGDQDAYDTIVNHSLAYVQTVNEPVPRFCKRPGDLVLQGSNNTLISLGYARESPSPSATTTSAIENDPGLQKRSTGTVDIVAGRGQGTTTAPSQIENSRGYSEVDKAPGRTSLATQLGSEGDPDFITDLSRLLVSMRSDVDADFALTPYSGNTVTSAVNDDAFVVAKSNNVRVVARQNGTVRIVKEGANSATIQIESDGTIIVDGPKIVIGSGTDNQTFLGDGATEPVILGDAFLSGLEAFLTSLESATGNLGIALAPINAAATTLKEQLGSYKSTVTKVK